MNHPSLFSKMVKPPAYKVCLALNHRWDQAWCLHYPELSPTKKEINNFLNKDFKTLAIETYFKTTKNTDCFFGFEYITKSLLDHKLFIEKYFEFINKISNKPFVSFMDKLSSVLFGANNLFLHSEPVEISLSNRYSFKSGGPCVIWKKGLPKNIGKNSLIHKLESYPNLLLCSDDYPSIELIFEPEPRHWFGYQVSKRGDNNKYILDLDEIEQFINNAFNNNP